LCKYYPRRRAYLYAVYTHQGVFEKLFAIVKNKMKTMRKIALVLVLAATTMFAAGQTKEEVKQMLSNPEAKMLVMDQISGDVELSREMMSKIMDACKADTAMRRQMMPGMMNSCMGDTAMRRHMMPGMMHAYMGDPEMRHQMMSQMMETCKADTTVRNCMMSQMMDACNADSAMMKSMHRHMMGNPDKKDSMDQRMKENRDSKAVEGLDKKTLVVIKKNQ